MFDFAYPWVFALIPLPLLVVFLIPPARQRENALAVPFFRKVTEISGRKPAKGAVIKKRNVWQYIFMSMIWLLMVVALASPQITRPPQKKLKTARSVMLAVDISASMSTRDWDGRISRWEAVKQVIREFITGREGDRMGLILFGSQAYLQVPLSTDLSVISSMLDEVEVGMAGTRTSLGNAIGKSITLFDADTVQKKVLILITDGVDSGEGIHPLQAARTAALDSITIYTMGIGNPQAGLFDVDETTLEQIAAETGGKYFLAINRKELEDAYQTVASLEPIEYEDETRPVKMLYFKPLSAAFLLAVFSQVLFALVSWIKRER